MTDWLRATVSYGTAFKAPTFNELYFPDYGNPALDAETSRSLEAGLAGQHGWGHWAVNAYRTVVDDLIAYDASISAPANVQEARIRGVELVLGSQLLGWDWNANYSLLEPENRSAGANRGNELARRAKQLFNLDLDRRLGAFSVGASLHAEDSATTIWPTPASCPATPPSICAANTASPRVAPAGASPTCWMPTTRPRRVTTSPARRPT